MFIWSSRVKSEVFTGLLQVALHWFELISASTERCLLYFLWHVPEGDLRESTFPFARKFYDPRWFTKMWTNMFLICGKMNTRRVIVRRKQVEMRRICSVTVRWTWWQVLQDDLLPAQGSRWWFAHVVCEWGVNLLLFCFSVCLFGKHWFDLHTFSLVLKYFCCLWTDLCACVFEFQFYLQCTKSQQQMPTVMQQLRLV